MPPPARARADARPEPPVRARRRAHCLELCPICRGAELLRAGGAPELRGQLDDVGREALLTLRALIDHYLERTERRPGRRRVEEIPID